MFIGIYSNTDWKSKKLHSKRPCVYRHIGDGYVEVLPCSTAHQFNTSFIPLPFRKDIGLRRATQLLLAYAVRTIIPAIWVTQVSECPQDIKESILDWEAVHTV